MTARRWSTLAACVALAWLAGCSDESGPECGTGTKLVDGACVPVDPIDACGAGTLQDGTTCYAVGQDASGVDSVGSDADGGGGTADAADTDSADGSDSVDGSDTADTADIIPWG
ncbi:MAG: hypothetical protein H6747_08260, partial [Deltaproteobacteria bacterium]|nr:hypothetical protein [Deltaproteobacteria bacterium]